MSWWGQSSFDEVVGKIKGEKSFSLAKDIC